MMRPMFHRTSQASTSESTKEISLERASCESKCTFSYIPLRESLTQGETSYQATESNNWSFPKFYPEREDGSGTSGQDTSSSCKPWSDFHASQHTIMANQARQGVVDLVDQKTPEKVMTTVIVSSMRGGHRCLAADSSKCAYMKYLSGNVIKLESRIQTLPSQVPEVNIKPSVKRERVENKNGSPRSVCNGCHKTFATPSNKRAHIRLRRCIKQKEKDTNPTTCDSCKTEFKLPKYLRNHILLQRCKGKAAKKSTTKHVSY